MILSFRYDHSRSLFDRSSWGLVFLVIAFGGCSSAKKQDSKESVVTELKDGDHFFRLAESDFDQGNYLEAVANFQSSLKSGLKLYSRSDAFLRMGNCFRILGQYQEALSAYDNAISADSQNFQAMIFKGIIYRLQKRFDMARKSYESAMEIKPQDANLQVSLGVLAIFQKNFGLATEHLELATRLDDSNSRAFANLALVYANSDRWDEANSALKKADFLGYPKVDVVQAQIDQLRMKKLKGVQDKAKLWEEDKTKSKKSE